MKTFLLLAISLTTALAQIASAEEVDKTVVKHPNKHSNAPANRQAPVGPRVQPNATVRQHTPVYQAPQINRANTNQNFRTRTFTNQDSVRQPNRFRQNSEFTPRVRRNPNVVTTPPATTIPQTNTTAQSNVFARNRSDWRNRNRTNTNVQQNRNVQQNQNWQQNQSSANLSWSDARQRHDRNRHDRGWWRSRYSRFALFGSGYYFWDNGYWFPAYGYDNYYNSYAYDEPIYGYNDLDPTQVIASVQTELQRLGYYRLAVDGLMGPGTRAAIANFQRDNGLSITAAIDRPTLQTLGLG
ncbi:MAG: hypothetical protein QOF24_717 [Verrucomicrobiota bacterium]|jgi:hypothetical protein